MRKIEPVGEALYPDFKKDHEYMHTPLVDVKTKITVDDIRAAVALLEKNNVPKVDGYYLTVLHPKTLLLIHRARYGGRKGRSASRRLRRIRVSL